MRALPDRFYLTGTDTDVGKTVTAAVLCAALGLDYWKPVQSGTVDGTDTRTVTALAGVRTHQEAYALRRPASPHAAAHDEGVRVDLVRLVLPEAPRLLVEGAGGWMVPYALDPVLWQADVVRHLALPVVVVARSGLGTLNHTLMTLRALRADGIQALGLVLVGPEHPENARDLAALGGVPVLFRLPRVTDVASAFPELVARAREAVGGAP